ncbi:TonB-dependent receptor [Compostibacter hankyongensis]|uniref:TonB-dependent receptor n=1 Tax=Compostibacter hankyongensis TaxID=1007089 RepID=A0ABP8GAZ0_9BACT
MPQLHGLKAATGLLLLVLLSSTLPLRAQQHLLKGKVSDDKGHALPGVPVMIKGTTRGTTTDENGSFALQTAPGDTLLVRTLGFQSSETVIRPGTAAPDIHLNPSASALNEVVVIGYGSQKKEDVTGAISSVSSRDIRNLPVRSAQEALQGKAAGVMVTQSSGSPGSLGVVHIRGLGSINGSNDPLYVVDGLPQTSVGWLNPNDIESMSILKDASAAAIYGARAANGVVIITTRKGSNTDGDIRVTLDAYYGIQSPWKRPHMLDAAGFIEYRRQAAQAAGQEIPQDFQDGNIDAIMKFINANTGSNAGTDWWKEITHYNAPTQSYNIGISGGGKKLTAASSVGYMGQDGIIAGSDYSRISWHNNLGADISKRVKLSSNFSLVYEKRRNVDENNPYTGTIFSAMTADPITPVFRNDLQDVPSFYQRIMDGYEESNPFSQYAGILYSNKPNPAAQIERMRQSVWEGITIKAGAALDVKILRPLTYRSNFSLDLARGISKGFSPSYFLNPNDQSALNTVSDNSSWSNYFVWENTFTYDETWGKHHLTALGGISAELTKGLTYAASIQGLVNNDKDMRIINAGTQNPGASGYTYSSSLNSYFGRVNYAYADKYILAANIRRDGTSNFAEKYRWGTFPSLSAAWRLTQEPFIRNAHLGWLDDAKIRASYGLIGNQNVGGGAYLSTYGNTSRYLFGDNGSPSLGAGRSAVGTAALQWETSKQADIGLEATLFKELLSIEVDYFNKRVEDMLLQLPLPSTLGYPNSPWVNAGTMVNKGWELSLTHRNHIGTFDYSVNANISTFRNEVISMGGGEPIYSTAHLGETITKTEEGMPIGYYFGWRTDGIFQTQDEVDKSPQKGVSQPGDLRFKDINGTDENGRVIPGADGILNAADRVLIGNPWPDFIYGLTLNGSWHRFDLSLFFQGSQGNDVMDILRYDTEAGTGWYNAPEGFLEKAWNGAGSTNKYYKISQDSRLNTNVSDYFVEDGSYLRLKNLQLGYNFPEAMLKRLGIPELRIYLAAQNLLTFTRYSGLDPEIGSTDPKLNGIDQGYYPQPRTFMIGINARF